MIHFGKGAKLVINGKEFAAEAITITIRQPVDYGCALEAAGYLATNLAGGLLTMTPFRRDLYDVNGKPRRQTD